MKLKYFISIILTLLLFSNTQAQNIENDFNKLISQAESSLKYHNYFDALNYLEKAEILNGSGTKKTKILYARAYIALKNWTKAKSEIQKYYSYNPSSDDVDFFRMKSMEKQADDQINVEYDLYMGAIKNNDLDMMNAYIIDYPYGKYIQDISSRIEILKNDEEEWRKAKSSFTTDAYYIYLNNFPNGIHAQQARIQIDEWDKKAYEKAINEDTEYSLNHYLTNYPKGKYRSTIRNKLNEKKEYNLYQKAVDSDRISDYENYINKYPNGKYKQEVNTMLKVMYLLQAEKKYKNRQYSEAKDYYQRYLNRFPYGHNAQKAQKRIKKCSKRQNKSGAAYIAYNFEQGSALGLSFGKLKTTGLGFYSHIRINYDFLKSTNSSWTINSNGLSNSPWLVAPMNNYANGNLKFSLGYSKNLVYPVWLHYGLGYAYFPVYQKVDEYESDGITLYDTVWMKQTDLSYSKLFWEFGADLKIGNSLIFKFGIERMNQNNIYQWGLGLAF